MSPEGLWVEAELVAIEVAELERRQDELEAKAAALVERGDRNAAGASDNGRRLAELERRIADYEASRGGAA